MDNIDLQTSKISSFPKWLILKKIACIKMKKNYEINLSGLARMIGITPTHPYFQEMFYMLIEANILKETRKIGNHRLFVLDKNKLVDIIKETTFYKEVEEFIHSKDKFAIT